MKDDESGSDEDLPIKLVGGRQLKSRPIAVLVSINGKELNMEVDTGAAVSILSEKTFRKIFPNAVLKPAAVTLRTYTGQRMSVVGQLTVLVKYQSQSHSLPLLIVAGDGPSLFGRLATSHHVGLENHWTCIHGSAKRAIEQSATSI